MTTTIYDLEQGAINDLEERLQRDLEHDQESELSDLIYEVADSRVPIYHYKLLEVAQSNLYLATCEPEL